MYCAREMRGSKSKEMMVTLRSFRALTTSSCRSGERNDRCRSLFGGGRVHAQIHLTRRGVDDRGASTLVTLVAVVREISGPALDLDLPLVGNQRLHRVGRQGDASLTRARLFKNRNFHLIVLPGSTHALSRLSRGPPT